MDSVDKFFRESHYNIIRILLGINGLWPYHTTGRRCGIYFVFLLVLGSGLTFEVCVRKSPQDIVHFLSLLFYTLRFCFLKTLWMLYVFLENSIVSNNYCRIRVTKALYSNLFPRQWRNAKLIRIKSIASVSIVRAI